MKKYLALLLVLALCLSLVGCVSDQAGDTGSADDAGANDAGAADDGSSAEVRKIAYIITGSLGDGGTNDAIYRVLQDAVGEDNVVAIECGYDASLYEPMTMDVCQSGEYDLVVAGFYNLQEPVTLAAEQYPDQKFLCYDVEFDYSDGKNSNIVSYQGKQNECAFLTGVVAAILTTSGVEGTNPDKKVGFVGAAENTAITDFLVGYIEGVNYIDSSIEVLYSFVGDWTNTAKAKELGFAQIQQGADVSYSVCGNAGLGNAEAALESGCWNLNVDQDWATVVAESNPELADVILTSSVKEYDAILREAMAEYMAGTLQYGVHHFVGWGDNAITMYENDTFRELFTDEMIARYDEVCDELAAGKIEVGTAIGATQEEIDAYKEQAKPF